MQKLNSYSIVVVVVLGVSDFLLKIDLNPFLTPYHVLFTESLIESVKLSGLAWQFVTTKNVISINRVNFILRSVFCCSLTKFHIKTEKKMRENFDFK